MEKKFYLTRQVFDSDISYFLWKTKEDALKALSDEDYDKGLIGDNLCEEYIEGLGLKKLPLPSIVEVVLNFNNAGFKRCPCGKGFIKTK